ncbi:MAG: 50S ribosomal protein L1 [Verrucomicrobiales bacterium]|nr:50S ribosomal protein L1 [Verrucomicrobiae bacterium]MCP5555104.1 50S ribosomal protein L1 [Akkermansiaceae bacterium]HRX54294.1 50S ribosomal protein L1 [Verrucomicrobiales bacterium]
MATKRSKRYNEAIKLVDSTKNYGLDEAINILKKFPAPKFNPTVTISFRLGVDPRQSDQMVRGTCPLPHGSGKEVRVLVLAEGDAATAAQAAGAEHIGYAEPIKKIQEGWLDFDVVIATPAAMAEVRKLGRQLGPRGLMPNPRNGTVTDDTAAAVKAVKAGRADFKLDKNGNISSGVGKLSFSVEQLKENAQAVIDTVVAAKPAVARGIYMVAITLAASMCPGVSLDVSPYRTN